jgi:choice-of-anchor C domain-containing protein
VTKSQIDYIGTYWKSADGQRSLDMNGSPGFGGIQQSFKTKKGQKYLLSFYLAANPGSTGGVRALAVRVADKREVFKADPAGKTADNMGWVTQTLQFTAQDEMTTLEFFSADEADQFSGPALDNVFVFEVKDPQK